ncbi:MAG: argininosuccinate lyase [Bacteroidetes bacterium]|nr:argininosuccinate lyase [Bacteroidota bacterium]MDA1019130.1 argininosuccinate lyase [Bacteroidota bacterium]
MKLWNKNDELNKKIENFTIGNDRINDLYLAKYDIIGSIAHAKMLCKINILNTNELNKLLNELKKINNDINNGTFEIEEIFEDVHSKIEYILTEKLGDVGKKIHTGRSRNDQVLVATQLYLKDELSEIKLLTKELFDILIKLSNENKENLIPGYTHMQVAMPSSFGLWFSAYAECLIDDILYINTAFKINDQNPLGSAAGYGSSFKIDRDFTTKELGFSDLKYNVVSAQMNRGKSEKSVAIAIGSIAHTLSKFSADICFYMTQELNFISFPNEITTGSSIMPHKKNPDVFELIRAKCNIIQSLSNEFTIVSTNLTSGYHRDMQVFKGKIIESVNEIKNCIKIISYTIQKIQIREKIVDDEKYKYMFSVENINDLVSKGMTFRDAYLKISNEIELNKFKPNRKFNHTLKGSIGNLCLKEIKLKMKNTY